MFDEEGSQGPRKYDGSLRAPMKKQMSAGSNQWLRNSDGKKFESRMTEVTDATEERELGVDQRNFRDASGLQGKEVTEGVDKENSNDGVIFSSQKRARIGENVIHGDVEMVHGPDYNIGPNTEVQEIVKQNQKNEQKAGAAVQARLGL